MPPIAVAERGISFQPSVTSMPLMRCTIRSPATPVPYALQQRQRAKCKGLNGTLGASLSHVSQSRFCRERSGGGGYSHAPVGSFRPSVSSTISTSPIAPDLYSSFAIGDVEMVELTLGRNDPTFPHHRSRLTCTVRSPWRTTRS